jgi:hypothetical protein
MTIVFVMDERRGELRCGVWNRIGELWLGPGITVYSWTVVTVQQGRTGLLVMSSAIL